MREGASVQVFQLRRKIIEDYDAYIRGFLTIKDERILELVNQALAQGHLWPDPLIQLNPSFQPGPKMEQLIADGELHPKCAEIFTKADGQPLSLYQHQVEGVRAAAKHKPYVVTTGTGSGKSLSYIIPIVHEALSRRKRGKIEAIIVYPMNALVNSQLGELEKYLGADPPVSFAAYTGQNKEQERQSILNAPPTILLTNYVMLELMLTRPEEAQLIEAAQGLRWLVLDELHTYRGRQGADVALLCRRVRAQCKASELLIVGTSATLSSGSGTLVEQREQIAQVAGQLFGAPVSVEQVIMESLVRATPANIHSLEALRTAIMASSSTVGQTYEQLQRDPLAVWIESTLGVKTQEGRLVRQNPMSLRGEDGLAKQLSEQTGVELGFCVEALERTLLAGANVKDSAGRPLFAFRMHQFISKGESVWASLEPPSHRYLSVNAQQFVPHSGRSKLLFPLVFCRECGHEYYVVMQHKDGVVARQLDDRSEDGEQEDKQVGYLSLEDPERPWPTDLSERLERLPDFLITQGPKGPKLAHPDAMPQPLKLSPMGKHGGQLDCLFIGAPLRWCLRCGVAYADRQKRDFARLATLGSEGRSTATTILTASSIWRASEDGQLPPHTRKILSFTDNRQDASLQAGHFNDFIQLVRLRSALYSALIEAPSGLQHDTIHTKLMEKLALSASEYALDPEIEHKRYIKPQVDTALRNALAYMLYKDQARGWRITSPNLEQCGLMEVIYNYLDEIAADEQVWSEGVWEEIEPKVRFEVSRALLDFMRRELAIHVDYLDPMGQENYMRQSSQHLREPWAIHDTERTHARWITTSPGGAKRKSTGSRLALVNLTARSNFGRYLRRVGTLGLEQVPNMEQTTKLLHGLLEALFHCGLLFRESHQGESVYQVEAGMLTWRASDGSAASHDPVRVPNTPEGGLRTNPYFVQLYKSNQQAFNHLKAQEHTAQIQSDERKVREQAFTTAALPVMFCSPTMELGVDISQLQLVNMRNVPPTPANYAQRSGRAGRSGQPALVLNYCTTGSPHDQYFFRNPLKMVSGVVSPPRLDLTNEELLRAHIHAIWLSCAQISLGKTLAEVLDLTKDDELPAQPELEAKLKDPATLAQTRQLVHVALGDILLRLDQDPNTPSGAELVEQTLAQLSQSFNAACGRWRELYRAAKAQADAQHRLSVDPTRSPEDRQSAQHLHKEALAQLNLLQDSSRAAESDFYSYRYFASEGFLPGYNFPRLPLSAYLPARGKLNHKDEFLNRPRFLALSEFGPKSIIYHNGARYNVQRVFMPAGQHATTRQAILCEACGELHPQTSGLAPDRCMRCQALLPAPLKSLFRMQNVVARLRERINSDEEERQRNGYELKSAVAMPRRTTEQVLDHATRPVKLTYGHGATLWRINMGWRHRADAALTGFPLDIERGDWVTRQAEQDADPQKHGRQIMRVIPYVEDHKNCLLLHPIKPLDKALMASVEAALKAAIQRVFQIEDRELASEPLPSRELRDAILFYEAAEGGAGVLQRLVSEPQMFDQVLVEALKLCHFDPEDARDLGGAPGAKERCEAACYDCLLSYYNQPDHALVDRVALLEVLQDWRSATARGEMSPAKPPSLPAPTPEAAAFLQFLGANQLNAPDALKENHYVYEAAKAAVFISPTLPSTNARLDLEDMGWVVICLDEPTSWAAQCARYPSVFLS